MDDRYSKSCGYLRGNRSHRLRVLDRPRSALHATAGGQAADRRTALVAAMQAIENYEQPLLHQLLDGLQQIPRIKVYGITDPARMHERVPTLALTVDGLPSSQVARRLGDQGIYCWHGHYYAIAICEALGQSQHGMLRIGLLHTNTAEEVTRTLSALAQLSASIA